MAGAIPMSIRRILGPVLGHMARCWAICRSRLREWSGDDAYERYLAEHRDHGHSLKDGHALLDRREFYRQYFDRRGKRPRCC